MNTFPMFCNKSALVEGFSNSICLLLIWITFFGTSLYFWENFDVDKTISFNFILSSLVVSLSILLFLENTLNEKKTNKIKILSLLMYSF